MTVCIAAKCEEGVIFGAADRMKTAADIQFEPSSPKIIMLTNSICAMTAGDAVLQSEILQEVNIAIVNYVRAEPKKWLKVKEIANLYAYFYSTCKLKRAENKVLIPIGLNQNTFIARQHEMSENFIASIKCQIQQFILPFVSVIITGIDDEGAHTAILLDL